MTQFLWNKTVILDIRTLALNRVRYLRSGFAHLLGLPDVSGSGVRSTPNFNFAILLMAKLLNLSPLIIFTIFQ